MYMYMYICANEVCGYCTVKWLALAALFNVRTCVCWNLTIYEEIAMEKWNNILYIESCSHKINTKPRSSKRRASGDPTCFF